MSLISDALKKAQRQRTGPDTAPPIPGVSRAAQVEPASSQSIVGIAVGAVVLVGLAIGGTIFFLRPKNPAPAPAVAPATIAVPSLSTAKTSAAPAAVTAAPQVAVPIITAPTPVVIKAPEPVTPPPVQPAPVPVASPPLAKDAPSNSGAAVAATQTVTVRKTKDAEADPRIISFVDAIRVAGIRSSGSDSKVLMNDKVFRVNDVVDRMLNVRLTDVQTDSLTFVDSNGVTYTKNF